MRIGFEGRQFEGNEGESVLECLERHGVQVPSFCRNGACQTCLMRAEQGDLPPVSQQGLKESWRLQGQFLACVCRPAGDLQVARSDAAPFFTSRILGVEKLSERVLRIWLQRPPEFLFEAGQFLQLRRVSDGLMRPYSIASLPGEERIELHVAVLPEGQMSSWLQDSVGAEVTIRGPYGECFYLPHEPDRPLLLAGTGTGLAPLLGVVRAALAAGHRARVTLLHGASARSGLYLWDLLQSLQQRHPQLSVTGSAPDTSAEPGICSEPLQKIAMADEAALRAQRVYLCGGAQFVRALRREVYLAGTPLDRIHADPFLAPARV